MVIETFGQNAFVALGEGLGENHVVFRSNGSRRQVEISVVAEEGKTERPYSVQVEVDIHEPIFEIPFVGKDLSIDEVLEVLAKYEKYA